MAVLQLEDLLQVVDLGPGRAVIGLQCGVVDVGRVGVRETRQLVQLLVEQLVVALQL